MTFTGFPRVLDMINKVIQQQRNVFSSLTQGWQINKRTDTVIQVQLDSSPGSFEGVPD
ncbi:MAG: hypothetical protein R2764_24065 [Bacteroidales bacterium]